MQEFFAFPIRTVPQFELEKQKTFKDKDAPVDMSVACFLFLIVDYLLFIWIMFARN